MTLDELKKFCDTTDSCWAMQQPWTRDGYTWATDRHIIVRVPVIPEVPDNERAPSATKLFAETDLPKEWMPVPEMVMPEDIACPWCGGTGKEPSDRRYKCEDCDGTRKVPDLSGVPFAGTAFAKRYLALIQGWEIAPNGDKAAWIRKDDALGLLMPRRI